MPVLTADGEALVLNAIIAYLDAEAITLYANLTTDYPAKAVEGTPWTAPTEGERVEMGVEIDGDELHNTAVNFGLAGAAEVYVGIEVWDAATTGKRHIYGPLTQELTVEEGQPIVLLAGSFKFSPDANA